MPAIGKEQLNHWLNRGFDQRAVAVYGTTVETLKEILDTGQIPWNQPNTQVPMLPYQRRLLKNGGYMYFAFPFLDRIRPHNPALACKIEDVFGSNEHQINISKGYACERSWLRSFYGKTGRRYDNWDELAVMSAVLFPSILRKQIKDSDFPAQRLEASSFDPKYAVRRKTFAGLESKNMSLPDLRQILDDCLARRGALLYYNEKIFQHTVEQGYEDEDEIFIISKEPLTAEVVSGIQILSNADRKALRSLGSS